jgi:hypothetical protein
VNKKISQFSLGEFFVHSGIFVQVKKEEKRFC